MNSPATEAEKVRPVIERLVGLSALGFHDAQIIIDHLAGLDKELEQWRSDNPPDYATVKAAIAAKEAAEQERAKLAERFERKVQDYREALNRAEATEAKLAGLVEATKTGLEFIVLFLAFDGRDRGTPRLDGTLDSLCKMARDSDDSVRQALASITSTAPVGERCPTHAERLTMMAAPVGEEKPFKCAARNSYPDPLDCDWPHCGCDERASKVVEALIEEGWGRLHNALPAQDVGGLEAGDLADDRDSWRRVAERRRAEYDAANALLKIRTDQLSDFAAALAWCVTSSDECLSDYPQRLARYRNMIAALSNPQGKR